jgi:DNA invertase Pin-like site-specific DNA recombinase
MVRYTTEFLAALRRCYEQTHQSERSIARAFRLPNTTLRDIASRQGWVRRPQPVRDLDPAMRLLEKATASEKQSGQRGGSASHAFISEAPLASIAVERYTPRLLAVLRRRYEQTRQSVRSIAREFGISDRTLRRIASKGRWRRPDRARRDLEPAARLLEEASQLERRYFGLK